MMTGQGPYGPPPYGGQPWHAAPHHYAPQPTGYEFNPQEEVTIERVGKNARRWGVASMVGGGLSLLLGGAVVALAFTVHEALFHTVGILGGALVLIGIPPLATGWSYYAAGRALRAVHTSRGDDVSHVLRALRGLTTGFQIEAIVLGLTLALMIALKVAVHALQSGMRL